MAPIEKKLATAKSIISAVGSVAATIIVARSVATNYLPPEFQAYLYSSTTNFLNRFSTDQTLVIHEFDGISVNEIYEAAQLYLGQKLSPNARRSRIAKPEKENHYHVTMERDEEVVDVFNGEKFRWIWISTQSQNRSYWNSSLISEIRSFELTFHKKNRDLVINYYLPFIAKEAKIWKQEKRTVKIFTVDDMELDELDPWRSVTLDHPATFDTLAMDSELKEMILCDLDRFVKRREYYRKVGKAWKRGYLLYGPPGTGKSSLIAAIANYLKFDVYDLELSARMSNSELRRLLLSTANKSILVVEDIDCSNLQEKLGNRGSAAGAPPGPGHGNVNKVTLSGFLNIVDGLWSSCGDERIIIFTTNHIEKLDPALLRPGRMDMHINLSYCTPCGFKLLASNYLGLNDHILFQEIEDLIPDAKVTPAEVAEQLLKDDDPDASLKGLIGFMHQTMKKHEQAEADMLAQDTDDEQKAGLERDGSLVVPDSYEDSGDSSEDGF